MISATYILDIGKYRSIYIDFKTDIYRSIRYVSVDIKTTNVLVGMCVCARMGLDYPCLGLSCVAMLGLATHVV